MSYPPLSISSCFFLIACSVFFILRKRNDIERTEKIRYTIFLASFVILFLYLIYDSVFKETSSSISRFMIIIVVMLPATILSFYELIISSKKLKKCVEKNEPKVKIDSYRMYLICAISLSYLLGALLAIITITESSLELKGHLFVILTVLVLLSMLWSDKKFLIIVKEYPRFTYFTFMNLVSSYLAIVTINHLFNSPIWQLYMFLSAALIMNLIFSLKDSN